MTAYLKFRDLLPVILPNREDGSPIGMITAYFDDSGTHPKSDVIVWAGLFGNQYQWESFDRIWNDLLDSPCPNKDPIKKFHTVECRFREGEFAYWSRTEQDYLIDQLASAVVRTLLSGIAIVVNRRDYDEVVTGDLRTIYGDAEAFCASLFYVRIQELVSRIAPQETEMAFVIDRRENRMAQHQAAYDIVAEENKRNNILMNVERKIELLSLTFASSKKFLPLQAADLFAYEVYQASKADIDGDKLLPRSSALNRFGSTGRLVGQIFDKKMFHQLAANTQQTLPTMIQNLPQ
jgi:hypothetical protein